MLSIVVSTIAYFIAAFFIARYMEEQGIPKGFTRSCMVFVLALAISYGVAWVVDEIAGSPSESIDINKVMNGLQ